MNRTHSLPGLMALLAGALLLGACDKKPNDPPKPQVEVSSTSPPATQGPGIDPSVPTATSVFNSASGTVAPAASGVRDNTSLTKTEQSVAMPMPGQVNDHSAPASAKGASAPR